MFWKESKGLNTLSKSSKTAVTAFLILIGIAYIFGFMNIYLTYSPVDKEKGLSINDIRYSFYGRREVTALEKSIDGSMREHFASDSEYNTVKAWIAAGAQEKDFGPVQTVFQNSCLTCHSADVAVAGVVLDKYSNVEPYLQQDTGKSISRLVSLSHTHLFAILTVIFILTFIFSFTRFPDGVKQFIYGLAYFAVALDVGSWWLAKSSAKLASFVLLGGTLLAVSFILLILLSLYDMWLRKKA
jgi:hypothetical protein